MSATMPEASERAADVQSGGITAPRSHDALHGGNGAACQECERLRELYRTALAERDAALADADHYRAMYRGWS